MPLFILVFLGSGFVPTASMPGALGLFARYQPFTPITETLRGLLLRTPIGNQAAVAVAWCLALGLVGAWWAMRIYDRDPVRQVRLLSVGRA
jgi:ABC-2 type transport system permease protein